MKRSTSRRIKIFGALVALIILLTQTTTVLPASAEELESEATFAVCELPPSLNPFHPLPMLRRAGMRIVELLYDTLLRYENHSIRPWLAERWVVGQDGRVYTFYLVRNASWHDGTPLTAYDVEFTFRYVIEHRLPQGLYLEGIVEDVKAVSDYVLNVTLKTERVGFHFLTFLGTTLMIVPRHIWDDIENPHKFLNVNPIGSGPFRLREFDLEERTITLEATQTHFKHEPKLRYLRFVVYEDEDLAMSALLRGHIDAILWSMDPLLARAVLEEYPDAKFAVARGGETVALLPNLREKPFDEPRFRKAVSLAISRGEIALDVYEGAAQVASKGLLPPTLGLYFNEDLGAYEFNLTKAAELIAGLPEEYRESPVEIYALEEMIPIGKKIQDNLRLIGLNATLILTDPESLIYFLHRGDFTAAIVSHPLVSFEWLARVLHSRGGLNFAGYNSTRFDSLIEKFFEEGNFSERVRIAHRMQEVIAEEIPMIGIVHPGVIMAYSEDYVRGWVIRDVLCLDNYDNFVSLYPSPAAKERPMPAAEVVGVKMGQLMAVMVIAVSAFMILLMIFRKRTFLTLE